MRMFVSLCLLGVHAYASVCVRVLACMFILPPARVKVCKMWSMKLVRGEEKGGGERKEKGGGVRDDGEGGRFSEGGWRGEGVG